MYMENDDKIDRLCDSFNQMVNHYGQLEKEFHTYEAGTSLHLSDTHTIVAIGKNANINISNLAKLQGISRSAVSQMVSKLVKRGFVRKDISLQTDNEVVLSLTETGEKVFNAHKKQHERLKEKLAEIFAKYPDDTIDVLMRISSEIQDMWKHMALTGHTKKKKP